jgi:hypothetical protein
LRCGGFSPFGCNWASSIFITGVKYSNDSFQRFPRFRVCRVAQEFAGPNGNFAIVCSVHENLPLFGGPCDLGSSKIRLPYVMWTTFAVNYLSAPCSNSKEAMRKPGTSGLPVRFSNERDVGSTTQFRRVNTRDCRGPASFHSSRFSFRLPPTAGNE